MFNDQSESGVAPVKRDGHLMLIRRGFILSERIVIKLSGESDYVCCLYTSVGIIGRIMHSNVSLKAVSHDFKDGKCLQTGTERFAG